MLRWSYGLWLAQGRLYVFAEAVRAWVHPILPGNARTAIRPGNGGGPAVRAAGRPSFAGQEEMTPMLTVRELAPPGSPAEDTVELPYDARCRSRLRAETAAGVALGLFLPRGTVLRDGDRLRTESGRIVAVAAAPEPVSVARASDALALARACYHLGNRHVPLQIGTGWVRYLRDHVLDEMVAGLGLDVAGETAPFEPEPGAYGNGRHPHRHAHDSQSGTAGHAHGAPLGGHGPPATPERHAPDSAPRPEERG